MGTETTAPSAERLIEIREHAAALTYAPTRQAAFELFAEIDRLSAELEAAKADIAMFIQKEVNAEND